MTDYDSLSAAVETDKSYMGSLTRSMSLVLEEFYQNMTAVGVSAVTGAGMDEFFAAVAAAAADYGAALVAVAAVWRTRHC
jgi:hypothetical protein